jgi:hypothetical protein
MIYTSILLLFTTIIVGFNYFNKLKKNTSIKEEQNDDFTKLLLVTTTPDLKYRTKVLQKNKIKDLQCNFV